MKAEEHILQEEADVSQYYAFISFETLFYALTYSYYQKCIKTNEFEEILQTMQNELHTRNLNNECFNGNKPSILHVHSNFQNHSIKFFPNQLMWNLGILESYVGKIIVQSSHKK